MWVKSAQVQSQYIIDGRHQLLFGPEIPLGRLHRRVSQKQLDLLQVPAGLRHSFAQVRRKS